MDKNVQEILKDRYSSCYKGRIKRQKDMENNKDNSKGQYPHDARGLFDFKNSSLFKRFRI